MSFRRFVHMGPTFSFLSHDFKVVHICGECKDILKLVCCPMVLQQNDLQSSFLKQSKNH